MIIVKTILIVKAATISYEGKGWTLFEWYLKSKNISTFDKYTIHSNERIFQVKVQAAITRQISATVCFSENVWNERKEEEHEERKREGEQSPKYILPLIIRYRLASPAVYVIGCISMNEKSHEFKKNIIEQRHAWSEYIWYFGHTCTAVRGSSMECRISARFIDSEKSDFQRSQNCVDSDKKENQPSSRIWWCEPGGLVRGRFTLWLHRDWSRSCITFVSLKLA